MFYPKVNKDRYVKANVQVGPDYNRRFIPALIDTEKIKVITFHQNTCSIIMGKDSVTTDMDSCRKIEEILLEKNEK